MSNQDILNAIAGIAARLSKLEVAVTGKSGGSAGAEEEEKAPQVEAFEAFNADKVKAFADACNAIGLEGMSKQVTDGFNNMGTLIDMGSATSRSTGLDKYASGMVDQVKPVQKNKSRGTDFQNHWFGVGGCCSGSFSWTLMGSLPVPKRFKIVPLTVPCFTSIKCAKVTLTTRRRSGCKQCADVEWSSRLCKEHHNLVWSGALKLWVRKLAASIRRVVVEVVHLAQSWVVLLRTSTAIAGGTRASTTTTTSCAEHQHGGGANKDALFAQIRAVQDRQKGGKTPV